jgi:hypothetical protein
MNRVVLANLALAAGFMLVLCLPAKGWTADKCCKDSNEACRGQNVEDKGACPVGNVCAAIIVCPSKPSEFQCDCLPPASSVSASPTELTFDVTNRVMFFTVTNVEGNIPLHIGLEELGDADEFKVGAPRKCKSAEASPAESEELNDFSLLSASATIPPLGCRSFRVKFTARKQGLYSAQVSITSDATETPTKASVSFVGSIGG